MKLIVTVTVRPEDVIGLNLPTIDASATAANVGPYKKVEPYLNYNRFVLDNMRGYKVEGYKLTRSGEKNLKLTIVFNDMIKASAHGCRTHLNLFRSMMAKKNLWSLAVYDNVDGTTGLSFQNRANATDKFGQAKPVNEITL